MTHEEFFDALKRGEIAPAYFFHGEEEHVKASALEALRARLLPQDWRRSTKRHCKTQRPPSSSRRRKPCR